VVVVLRALFGRAADQPRRAARGERAWGPRRPRREGLIAAAVPWRQALRLAEPPDRQGDKAIPALKALACNRAKQLRAVPTPRVPACQESGFLGIKTAPIAIMSRLPFRTRRALEVPLPRAPTAADPLCDRIEGPSLRMTGPHLLVVGPPSGTPLAGQSCRRGGRQLRCERHRGWLWGSRRTGRSVPRRGRGGALGIDTRQLGRLCGAYVGQHGGQMLQQMTAVGHPTAMGAPVRAASAYAAARSRTRTSTPGCACRHCATVAASRSGSRARGRRRARSSKSVP
jgi:hypothetical protein